MEMVCSLSTELLATALVLLVTYWAINRFLSNKNLPPGPWGWPVIGSFFSLKVIPDDYACLQEKYGDVFSFRGLGGHLFVVLNGAKVIKEVLVNRADEFDGRPKTSNLLSWISNGLGVAQEEGDPWQEHRRFYAQTVRRFGVGKQELEDKIQDEVQQMISGLRKQEGQLAKLPFHVASVTSSVISEVLYGRKMDKQGDLGRVLRAMHQFVLAFQGKFDILTGWGIWNLGTKFYPKLKLLKRERDVVTEFTEGIINDQVATFDPSHQRGYVDAYLKQKQEHQEKGVLSKSTFTMERLNGITFNMFYEGSETTASAILNLLLELAEYPEVQKRVQEELDSVVGRERLPSFEDRKQMPYGDATIQELYRMVTVFPTSTLYSNFSKFSQALYETTINGYRIPKRSILFANLSSIHFDPMEFPNPRKFEPKRFLDEEGKKIKKEGPYPFGVGKRSCVGEAMAIVEVFLILTSILQSFTLLPVEGEERDVKLLPRD